MVWFLSGVSKGVVKADFQKGYNFWSASCEYIGGVVTCGVLGVGALLCSKKLSGCQSWSWIQCSRKLKVKKQEEASVMGVCSKLCLPFLRLKWMQKWYWDLWWIGVRGWKRFCFNQSDMFFYACSYVLFRVRFFCENDILGVFNDRCIDKDMCRRLHRVTRSLQKLLK